MARVSFLELARTGAFASVRLGASRADVVAALGEPDDVDAESGERIYRYGTIELHFADDVLWLIHTDCLAPVSGGRLELDDWQLSSGTELRDLVARLTSASVEYEISDYSPVTHSTQVVTASGLALVFSGSDASVPFDRRSLEFLFLRRRGS